MSYNDLKIFPNISHLRATMQGWLNIVINVDKINQVSMEEAIGGFREIGEANWSAAQPVLRSELPMESANSAFSKIRWEPNELGKG